MRTFIAISIPSLIKTYLGNLQDKLKSAQADVKWVTPENIHLTLKFLGEIESDKLSKTIEILETIAKNRRPFSIHINSVGVFPRMNSPRVIWVGIDKGANETKQIARGLEERLQKIGIPQEDREFSSHVTIGRIRSALNRDKLTQQLKDIRIDLTEFSCDKIILFKSTLSSKGPIYETLKEANLTNT